MARIVLYVIAALSVFTGLSIFFDPMTFYETTPGVSATGPFSIHFIKDVGLAYLAFGSVVAWGTWKASGDLVLAAAVWPALHTLFHVQMWGMRGFPLDFLAGFEAVGLLLPAALLVWGGWQLRRAG